jgi:hypothetical protein
MKPRGPLMIEHRLIEKMLAVVRDQLSILEKEKAVDPLFLDTAVDFIRRHSGMLLAGIQWGPRPSACLIEGSGFEVR